MDSRFSLQDGESKLGRIPAGRRRDVYLRGYLRDERNEFLKGAKLLNRTVREQVVDDRLK